MLRENPFHEDAAEDWNLTAYLWSKGRKVVYAPDIVVESESPDHLWKVIHRFSLWAEAPTHDTIAMAGAIVDSRDITKWVKWDFFLSGLSYLMSVFVIIAVVGVLLVPFPLFGGATTPIVFRSFALALVMVPSAPITMVAATHADGTERRLLSAFIAIFGLLVVLPFVAFTSLNGLLGRDRSPSEGIRTEWIRADETEEEA